MSQTGAYSYAAQGYGKGANIGDLLPWYSGCEALWQSGDKLVSLFSRVAAGKRNVKISAMFT